MEKLIELLNEYQKWKEKSEWTDDNFKWEKNYKWSISRYDEDDIREWENLYNDTAIAYLISKSFWFIKWLVENEKIKPLRKFIGWETDEDEPYIQFDLVDQYIAYLSIQDNPIEFLVSILK